jgi:uncharacterized protein YjaZ
LAHHKILIAGICAALAAAAVSTPTGTASAIGVDRQQEAAIRIEDVARFYEIYDAASGHPTAEQLQHDYLDPGSSGLHRLATLRKVTGAAIAANIEKNPQMYSDAKRCLAVLPRVRERLRVALNELKRVYPEAQFPPVTIAVGRGKPVGVADSSGVMIGLELMCATTWMNPNLEDRFVHSIAHEYAHVQQALAAPALYDDSVPTVLEASLVEGAAEFTAELVSGDIGNLNLRETTRGHEKEIETAFVPDEDSKDLSKWLYNSTLTKPGDLGYWVGYRIAKAYYQHAADKRRAFREILQMSDAKALLAKSGWYPGIAEQ